MDTTWQWLWFESNDQRRSEKKYHSLPLPGLPGQHQVKNATGALMVTALLNNELPLSMPHLRLGLTAATLPGRFQVIPFGDNKLQIFDVAHNPHGIGVFLENLQNLPKIGEHLLVFGMLRDKALSEVIDLLKDHVDRWFLCNIQENRGLSAMELKHALLEQGVSEAQIQCFEKPVLAFESARSKLQNYDKLLVLGSFYVVAEGLAQITH
jgi:dihydrofolate synthase/folylpolyglutamate synthase